MRRIFLLTVRQFAIRVKGIFLFDQKICLGPLFRLSNLGSLLCTGKNGFEGFQIPVKIKDQLFSENLACSLGCILIVELCLGLSFKSRSWVLDGNNCSHSISDISPCEIRVFVFEDTDLTGIIVHHRSKRCFKSGQMRSALCIVNIVTETKNILTEITGILKSHFYLDTIRLAFQINRLMQCLRIVVQIADISDDPLRFMVFQFLRLCCTQILKINRQFRIKVCSFMKTAFDLCRRKTGFFKNFRIRKKINAGSCRFRSSQFRKKPLLQLNSRDSSLIMIMMYISISADTDIQIRRKCIDNRRTHTMKSSTGLVCGIVKLTACMQRRKHQSLRRHSLLMHVYRDSSSVICHCSGTILLQCHMDLTAVSGKMLIHCIVYDLIDQMI